MQKIMGLIAFLVLAGFLGILIWKVPRADLILVVGSTIVLVGYDLYSSLLRGRM